MSEAGLQPMSDRTGRFHLIFNGEIYNYIELREQLLARGYVFVSNSDSEVLLAAYMEWNEGCLDRLLGMFAFVIWDLSDNRLFAARDRFGIKPLYLTANRHGVALASEIKQLRGLPGYSGHMNLPRVRDFLQSGISDHTTETLFDGINQVPPGCFLIVDTGQPWTGEIAIRRWYSVPPHSTLSLSEGEAAEKFRALFTDAVRMHLRSDVPIGSCLSGGLDSSSIVGVTAQLCESRESELRFHTVSACYDERSVDEREFMEAVVAKARTRPHYVYPRAEDVFRTASDITWHHDEPFGSTSIFAQWCVFEEAKRSGIKVMLDGQGADEQLAGYHSSYSYYLLTLVRRFQWMTVVRTMLERRSGQGASLTEQLKHLAGPLLPSYLRSILVQQRQAIRQHGWMNSEAFRSSGYQPSAFEVAVAANNLPEVKDVASLCVALTFSSNLQMLLHYEDRNSMAHSIEARVPFLDHRLVEFALALGNDHKIVQSDTKRVLRRAMKDVLPAAVYGRRDKLGFSTPEQEWFRGPLRDLVRGGVEATLTRFPGLLSAQGTRAFASDMLDGRRPVDFTLWRIVNIGIWGERFAISL